MDYAHGEDLLSVGAQVHLMDPCRATTRWTIRRYTEKDTEFVENELGVYAPTDEAFNYLRVRPYMVSQAVGNLITNNGWTRLMSLLTNQSATQALDSTHTRIGVGNSNTAEAYTDTDLGAAAGSANRWFQPVSGAGTLGTRTLSFSASFGSSDGNFAWNEFGIDVTAGAATAGNTVGALLFNHKAGIAQGTKASGQTWTATATITFT
jgi:hypothetical protein